MGKFLFDQYEETEWIAFMLGDYKGVEEELKN